MGPKGYDAAPYSVPFFINGQEVHPQGSFDVVSPATGEVVHKSGSATNVEVTAAIDAAVNAFKTWKQTLPRERRDIFLKAAEVMQKRADELAGYMMEETGCPKQWADVNIGIAKDFLYDMAGRVSSLEGTIPITRDLTIGAMVLKEPFGVILAIAPWWVTPWADTSDVRHMLIIAGTPRMSSECARCFSLLRLVILPS